MDSTVSHDLAAARSSFELSLNIQRDVAANFAGKIWTGALNFLVVPIYIKYLGMEAYGLIGFFASLLAVSLLLDLGLSTALNRELARIESADDSSESSRNLMRSLEYIYWGVAIGIGLLVIVSARQLATVWLAPNGIGAVTTSNAIVLMGTVIALRWPATLYFSGLMGLHKQVLANVVGAAMITLQAAISIFAMLVFGSRIEVFFYAQVLAALVNIAVLATCLWNCLPSTKSPTKFSIMSLKSIWHFAAGVSGITICSVILTQADKVFLSKLLSLENFGYYVLANSIAGVLNLPAMAMYAALFPAFSKTIAGNLNPDLSNMYHVSCQMLSVLIVPPGILLCLFSKELLALYVHDPTIVARTSSLLSVIALGNTFLGVMVLPLALQFAYGWTRLSLYKNVIAVVIYTPCMIVAVQRFGAIGAAFSWLSLALGYVLVEVPLMHRVLLTREKRRWYLFDLGVPLLICAIVMGVARLFMPDGSEWGIVIPTMAFAYLGSTGGCYAVFRKWGRLGPRYIQVMNLP